MLLGAGYALSSKLGIPVRYTGVLSFEESIFVGLPIIAVGLVVVIYGVRKKDTTKGGTSN